MFFLRLPDLCLFGFVSCFEKKVHSRCTAKPYCRERARAKVRQRKREMRRVKKNGISFAGRILLMATGSQGARNIYCTLYSVFSSQLYNAVQSAKCMFLFVSLRMTSWTVTYVWRFSNRIVLASPVQPRCRAVALPFRYPGLRTAPQYVTAAVSRMRPLLVNGGTECCNGEAPALGTPPVLGHLKSLYIYSA